MKTPIYEVEVLASTDGGNTYRLIKVLTLDDCYNQNDYESLKVVGYVDTEEES